VPLAGAVPITSATFSASAYANTVRGAPSSQRGVSSLAITGVLRTDMPTRVLLRSKLRAASGVLRLTAEALTWRLDYALPRTTLTFDIRVVAANVAGCATGARGTLVLVDDDGRLPNGASSDQVSLRFARGACIPFVRTWGNGNDPRATPTRGGSGSGHRATVEIAFAAGSAASAA
jgi:hypothetical protein